MNKFNTNTVLPEPVEGQLTGVLQVPLHYPNRCNALVKAIVVWMLLVVTITAAHADQALTAKELLGRRIYRAGEGDSLNPIRATLGLSADTVSASAFPCANCHGLEGEGKQEGGLNVPAIASKYVFTESQVNRPQKQTYDESTLARAITKGISSENRSLSMAMPRYGLSEYQTQVLLAYLRRLGTASDIAPGVTVSEVRLATLLPLTGPLAETGKLLHATLESCIAEMNRQGSIYGRKLILTALDSGSTAEETLPAARRLISEIRPFALVSGYLPEISPALYELFVHERMPVIAPLTFEPKEAPIADAPFFYFLPGYADQSRALVDYWLDHIPQGSRSSKPKLAIVYGHTKSNRDTMPTIHAQMQRHHLNVMAEVDISSITQKTDLNSIESLMNGQPDAVLFLGSAGEFETFGHSLEKSQHKFILLALLAMLGTDALTIPESPITKMMLATPFKQNYGGLELFADRLEQFSVDLQSPVLQRIACSAVNFVGEGLKISGKNVSQNNFVRALEAINNFPVEIMPPLQFDPKNGQGLRGAYIYTKDPKSGDLSKLEWVTPMDVF
ncbi:MAG: ABC transporter substrate-binding protein [Methylococcaceae bacterium]|nr:ABC transporter substrate-binding protein [Methylococcaceae bacterium]